MQKFGIGQSVRRTEDVRFVTGTGAYTDDLNVEGQAYGFVLRSPFGHAKINSIDVSAAQAAPGVIAVLTGADIVADGLGTLPCVAPVPNADGSSIVMPPRAILQHDRVRYVGDPVAFVVAESVNQAKDAAELIDIDYEDLPAVGTIETAEADGAALVWDDAPGNVCLDWEMGNKDGTDEAFANARHVSRIDLVHNRIAVNAMETRAALGEYDAADEQYTLRTSTQGANGIQGILGGMVMGIDPSKLRVFTPDVGGGFGMKTFVYPEQALVLWAAKRIGRAVKWTGERAEAFQGDSMGRDWLTHAELAVDENNRITAFRVHNRCNLGAYLSQFAPFIATVSPGRILGGVYKIPNIHVSVTGLFSNTCPVDAYRGAGRPESAYIIERAINHCAAELGIPQDEFRSINFIPTAEFPYQHPLSFVFDSGDYHRNMADAKRNAKWDSFEERRAESANRGMLRGIGMAYYIECTIGGPSEAAKINFLEDETVEIITGTMSNGQGHETAWAQVVVEQLGVPFENVKLVQGDTDRVATGGGTGGSHSLYMAAGAFQQSSNEVIKKGKIIASLMLEDEPQNIDFDEGLFKVPGTNKSIGIMEVAAKARQVDDLPGEFQEMFVNGLDSAGTYEYETSTFPNGCHICEVEIDPSSGETDVVGYTVVDDFGKVVNPMIVAGQVHGGVVQGLGQSLMEECVYDGETAQLVTGSFMDYCMPRADDICDIDFSYNEILCTTNPYGIKGCGEAGTIGACPSSINAIVDALRPVGVNQIEMPATPLKVWQAIQDGTRQAAE